MQGMSSTSNIPGTYCEHYLFDLHMNQPPTPLLQSSNMLHFIATHNTPTLPSHHTELVTSPLVVHQ